VPVPSEPVPEAKALDKKIESEPSKVSVSSPSITEQIQQINQLIKNQSDKLIKVGELEKEVIESRLKNKEY